jgi:hypothetical protein
MIFYLTVFGFTYCQMENGTGYESNGKITGPDYRMCPSPCCSGWFIEIDSLTYEFDSIPANANINLQKETFPIPVKLDWKLSDKIVCPIKRITIQRIIKVDKN